MPGSAQPRYKPGPQSQVGYPRVPLNNHGALFHGLWTRTVNKPDSALARSEPTVWGHIVTEQIVTEKMKGGKEGEGLWERGPRDASWRDLPKGVLTAR